MSLYILGFCGRKGSGKNTAAAMLAAYGAPCIAFADPIKRLAHTLCGIPHDQLFGDSEGRETLLPPDWADRFFEQRASTAVREELEVLFRQDSIAAYLALGSVVPVLRDEWSQREPLRVRHLLQYLGTEWGRTRRPSVWIDYGFLVAKELDRTGAAYDERIGLSDRRTRAERWAEDEWTRPAARAVCITDVRFANEVEAIHAAGGRILTIDAQSRLPPEVASHSSEPPFATQCSWATTVIDNNGSLAYLQEQMDAVANTLELSPVRSRG